MSLYVSEWIGGYDFFLEIADELWNPIAVCVPDPDDYHHVITPVSIFDTDLMNELIDSLGSDIGHNFLERLRYANDIVLKDLDVRAFLEKNLSVTIKQAKGNFKEASFALTDLFLRHIFNYEFWHQCNLVEVYANLIFYNTKEKVQPLIFFIPPINKWDEYPDGWVDYDPFNDF